MWGAVPKKCFPSKREGVEWLSFQTERTNKKTTAEVMESPSLEMFRSVWMWHLRTWVSGGLLAVLGNGWTWSWRALPASVILWNVHLQFSLHQSFMLCSPSSGLIQATSSSMKDGCWWKSWGSYSYQFFEDKMLLVTLNCKVIGTDRLNGSYQQGSGRKGKTH